MKRRTFVCGAFTGTGISGAFAKPAKLKGGDIQTIIYCKTGVRVHIIARGGARMDLHPDVKSAAANARRVYEIGVSYLNCARAYWDGKSRRTYGLRLSDVRNNISLTSKSGKRTRKEVEADLQTTLRLR